MVAVWSKCSDGVRWFATSQRVFASSAVATRQRDFLQEQRLFQPSSAVWCATCEEEEEREEEEGEKEEEKEEKKKENMEEGKTQIRRRR